MASPFAIRRLIAVLVLFSLAVSFPGLAGSRVRGARVDVPAFTNGDFVQGTVTAVRGSSVEVAGVIDIDLTGARIVSTGGRTLSATDVTTGAQVLAFGSRDQSTGRFAAKSIVVFLASEATLSGAVESVDLARQSLMIFGEAILIAPSTEFIPGSGLEAMQAGDRVIVTVVREGNVLVARRVVNVRGVFPGPIADLFYEGVIEQISSTTYTVSSRVFTVNAQTLIVGQPRVGDSVVVLVDPSSPTLARAILSRDPRPEDNDGRVTFEGRLEEKANSPLLMGGLWRVAGRDVFVTPQTLIIGAPALGDRVRVTGSTFPFSPFGVTLPVFAEKIEKL